MGGQKVDNQFDKDICRVLSIAEDLLELANHNYVDSDKGVFLGVMRDYAYRIRRLAEQKIQSRKRKANWGRSVA
jgi:hypothetical protein